MISTLRKGVNYSASLKIPLTASGIALQHKQWQKEMEEKVTEMVDAHMQQVERHMFLALTKGTNVMYVDRDQPDDGLLYVCGVANCNGIKATAEDPLMQNLCPLRDAHCRVKSPDVRECYEPRVIDEQVAQQVNRMYPSKAYNQMWGMDDDPEEWEET
jgi:hypothetical protein